MARRRRDLAILFASAALAGAASCRPARDANHPSRDTGHPSSDATHAESLSADPVLAGLESCNKGEATRDSSPIHLPATVVQAPSTRRTFRDFTLVIPGGVVASASPDSTGVSLTWPNCAWCEFGVSVEPDSGVALEERIARRVAEQQRIDSVNRDPKTVAHEIDEMDHPPRPFKTATAQGYEISESCGDCVSTTLVFGHPGLIATISFGGDDNAPGLIGYVCQMHVIAKTFGWRSDTLRRQ